MWVQCLSLLLAAYVSRPLLASRHVTTAAIQGCMEGDDVTNPNACPPQLPAAKLNLPAPQAASQSHLTCLSRPSRPATALYMSSSLHLCSNMTAHPSLQVSVYILPSTAAYYIMLRHAAVATSVVFRKQGLPLAFVDLVIQVLHQLGNGLILQIQSGSI